MTTREQNIARGRRGFTMMELLSVVAIIAVAMAISFPIYAAVQNNMRAMQLSSSAQQIYNTAQNRLSALQSNGQLSKLETAIGDTGKLKSAPTAPTAYTYRSGLSTSWSDYGMYAVSSNGPAISGTSKNVVQTYLITDASSLGNAGTVTGDYVIELSPSTGEVYAVYYWEGDATSTGSYATFDADQLKTNHIGYYGGKSIDEAIDHNYVIAFKDLSFTVVNSEELYAKVYSTDIGNTVFDPNNLSVSVTVSGTSVSGSWSQTFTGGSSSDNFKVSTSTDEIDIILDSMRSGLDFYSITGGNIVPGTNIKVSAALTYQGNTYDASNRTAMQPVTTNSYFADYNTLTKAVQVSAVRHLNHLRADTSHSSNYSYYWNQGLTNFSSVVQKGNIDFNGADWEAAPECVSVQSRITTSGNGYNPLTTFSPIENSYYNTWGGTFNGSSNKIMNFVIEGGDYAGLFGGADSYLTYSNVYMTDTSVTGTGKYVGALTGFVGAGGLSNCHNEVTSFDNLAKCVIEGADNYVGGLVGYYGNSASNLLTGCSATTNVRSTNGSYVGGLVGRMAAGGGSIKSCTVGSSDIVPTVSAYGSYVGGLVGRHDGSGSDSNAALDSCAANANALSTGGSWVGGLAGYVYSVGSKIADCSVGSAATAVSVSSAGDYAGGLVGQNQASTTSGCTAIANVSSGATCAGGLIGANQTSYSTIEDCSVGSAATAVSVSSAGDYAGGLVGQNQASTTSGCSAIANVSSGATCAGGLIGANQTSYSTIADCSVGSAATAVSVSSAGDYAGGLVGQNQASTTSGCSAIANVSSGATCAGGLIGANQTSYSTIADCSVGSAATAVSVSSAGDYAGGLVGQNQAATTSGCSAILDTVTCTGNYAGGFIGQHAGSYGTLSSNTATFTSVRGDDYVGGFIGQVSSANITLTNDAVGADGAATQWVSSDTDTGSYVGGFVGYIAGGTVTESRAYDTSCQGGIGVGGFFGAMMSGTVNKCFARGNPDADVDDNGEGKIFVLADYGYAGGFVGYMQAGSVSNCYTDANIGTVTLPSSSVTTDVYVGGFVGYLSDNYGSIDACYASGDVSGSSNVGGFAGFCASYVNNCITTSNVWGSRSTGGFFGSLSGYWTTYTDDISYGRVRNSAGAVPSGAGSFGGFVGAYTRTNATFISGCTYLSVAGYNENISTTTSGFQPASKTYTALKATNPTTETHAYKAALKESTFPFAMVGDLPYYGDWPATSFTATWKDASGTVLATTKVELGSTPVYDANAYGTPAPYWDANWYYVWDGSWSPMPSAISQDTTFVADYTDYIGVPTAVQVMAGGTRYTGTYLDRTDKYGTSSTLWGSSGLLTKSGNVSAYAAAPFSNRNKAYAEKSDRRVDSEAPFYYNSADSANAATSVRNQLANAGYPVGLTDNTSGLFSWCIYVRQGTLVSVPSGYETYFGYNTSTKSHEGGFVVMVGEKIPDYATITDEQKNASYRVILYDAGRAADGLAPYRTGTVKIEVPSGQSYYAYKYSSSSDFTATSDWFTL